jgi:hypothetical protein
MPLYKDIKLIVTLIYSEITMPLVLVKNRHCFRYSEINGFIIALK